MNNNEISDYHKTRTILDFKFIKDCFERDERSRLSYLQNKYPNHIIRMVNADLIAKGLVNGIGGSIPNDWNGSIYQD